jgi:hypothetical protein
MDRTEMSLIMDFANKVPVPKDRAYFGKEMYYDYSSEIIEEFKIGLRQLQIAYIYTKRIDYLLSGDDGEDSFLERLTEELL